MLRAYDFSIRREVHNEIFRINRRERVGVDQFDRTFVREPQVLATAAGVVIWTAEHVDDGVGGLAKLHLRKSPFNSAEPRK